jgi:GNAT superfamily N-acetyltransferase
MEIAIRDWVRADSSTIAAHWIAAYRQAGPDDRPLRHDAERVLAVWVKDRQRDRGTLGHVAESEGEFAGFAIGRVVDWGTEPPILKPVRVGVIEAVYVSEPFRRLGVGTGLVEHIRNQLESRGVVRLETSYETGDAAAAQMWGKIGFRSQIQMASLLVGTR